ncbi:phage tail tube protein [Agromyces sp. NPDC058064]|uniref:phage tail tube protein n=1 Tax=Agromyces sp. NPDC058064 TaxID=3346322 RepID=UPI0036D848FE
MSEAVPLPAGSTLGKSFEYGMDVNLGTYDTPDWQPIRRMSGYQPTYTPTTQDAQTYDDLGAANQDVTGWSHAHAFNVQVNRSITTGAYLPEIEAIRARTLPSAKGAAAVLDVRWYHKPESGEPNPTDAGRGFVTVAYQRQNTGPNGEIEQWSVTLTGKGPYEEIANPFAGWDAEPAPAIISITPSGQGEGDQIVITGSGFLGATDVKFAAVSASAFTVVSATTIVASLPAGSAGSVNVTVITPVGTSPAKAYTRVV